MKNLLHIFCAAIICIGIVNTAGAQSKTDKKITKIIAIANMVDNKNFIFNADYHGAQTLDLPYNLAISHDTVSACLPYFGESHLSYYGSTDPGINFKWTKCTYKVISDYKGNKEISITPTDLTASDANVVHVLKLYITANGNATLWVNSANRDNITFTGSIERSHRFAQASL